MAASARQRPASSQPGGLLASAAGFATLALGTMMLLAVLTGTGQLRLGTQASLAGAARPLLAAPWMPAARPSTAAAGTGSQAPTGSGEEASGAGPGRSQDGDWGSTGGGGAEDSEAGEEEDAEEEGEEEDDEGVTGGEGSGTATDTAGNSSAALGGAAAAAPAGASGAGPGRPAADISCSEALAVKKVALLFLTTRRLAHEKLWRLWMWDAARLAPLQAVENLQAAVCEAPPEAATATWRRAVAACAPRPPAMATTPGGAVELPEQHLFSVYVHAPPHYKGLDYQPLFQSRVLPQRLRTWWGTAAITDAERVLLAAALRDPANERFVLVSDHGVPLYDPLTTYQQLMAEGRSRVRACPKGSMSADRWNDGMATKRLQKRHWRKSSQFFSLTRRHAEAVVRDSEVYSAFKERCDERRKLCVPDEHYIPTLLAVLGLENETYCDGWGVAYTDWSRGGMHPRSFKPREVTPALFKTMRWNCPNATEAAQDAAHMFVPLDELLAAGDNATAACRQLRDAAKAMQGGGARAYAHPLSGACPLTARKFPPYTTLRVRQLFLSSCPPGASKVRSKAAATFGFQPDPSLALFRGQACTLGVEKTLGSGGAAGGRGRRLLCALWSAPARWLPLPAALLDACDVS